MLQQALDNPGSTRFPVIAQVYEVKDKEFSQGSGKPFHRVGLDDGQLHRSVKIFVGRGPEITQQQVGQRLQFSIGGYVSTFDQQTYLSGFWNSNAQVRQDEGQAAPQNPPQAPQARQVAPQPPKPAQNDRNQSIERQCAFKAACAYCGAVGLEPEQVPAIAIAGAYFITTGNDIYNIPKPDPTITQETRPYVPGGDDVPF